jgi:hypothetical protein
VRKIQDVSKKEYNGIPDVRDIGSNSWPSVPYE